MLSSSGSGSLGSIFGGSIGSAAKKVASSAAKTASSYKPPAPARTPTNNTYRAPAPAPYVAPRPAIGNTRTGNIAPASPPPQPTPMSPDQWLANDTAYKSQRAAYEEALRNYATQLSGEQGKYTNEWNANVQKLGTDRSLAQTALTDDYASRGLSTSGLYANAMNQFNTEWDNKTADLNRAKEAYINDLLLGQQNFQKEQSVLMDRAKQEALNRRADRYGL